MAEMPETVFQPKSLNEILAEYESAVDAGKKPDPQAYLERYPEYREELKKFFANEGCIDKILSKKQRVISQAIPPITEDKKMPSPSASGDCHAARFLGLHVVCPVPSGFPALAQKASTARGKFGRFSSGILGILQGC